MMWVIRSPLRLSIAGGGSDLPPFYRRAGGRVLSLAIDKYVYAVVNRPQTDDDIRLKYSRVEQVDQAADVQHELVRAALCRLGVSHGIEIVSLADIPDGSGLGSSGAFCVALLLALGHVTGRSFDPEELATQACQIEMEDARRPSGIQDAWISALGGVRDLWVERDGRTTASEDLQSAATAQLCQRLSLYWTGRRRSSVTVLRAVGDGIGQSSNVELATMREAADRTAEAFLSGDLHGYAKGMRQGWQDKRDLSPATSSPWLDATYELALANGALAGKVVGAGGGGFFLFLTEDAGAEKRLAHAMVGQGLRPMPFAVDSAGARVCLGEGQ
jgi:D-glycero-alpha-D-manno-heptose-7-phosphate kinase